MQEMRQSIRFLESYCRNLAITILNLQTIFDMETFVIGGGISAHADSYQGGQPPV